MLNHYKNFKEGNPSVMPDTYPIGTVFIIDDEGRSWYELMNTFSDGTYKIQYDSEGRIQCVYKGNPSGAMWPINASVIEINALPEGFVQREFIVSGDALIKSEPY